MNPLFPQGYDLDPDTPHQYDEIGSRKTIKDQLKRPTVANLDYEIQRRFVGVQLDLYENYGVFLGPGTGQRNSNPEVATGSSWHQPIPYDGKNQKGARAIDTVGLPTHYDAWKKMQLVLNKYGFASFQKGTNQFNYTGRPANVKDDPPHIQAFEDPYSRPRVGIKPLQKWSINPRYDLDLINLNDPLPEITTPPVVIPPINYPRGTKVKMYGLYAQKGRNDVFAAFSTGDKLFIHDPQMQAQMENIARINGVNPEVQFVEDPAFWRALGPVRPLTTNCPGGDYWGWVL